jgi:hypothetical protein
MTKKIDKDAIQSKDLVVSINNNRLYFSKAFVIHANLVDKYVNLFIDHKNQRIAFEFLNTKHIESYKVNGISSEGYYAASAKVFELDWVQSAQLSDRNKIVAFLVENKWIISITDKKIKNEEKVIWEKIINGSKKSDNAEVNFNVTQKRKWISFTTKFVKRAQIELKRNVQIYADSINHRLRFQFFEKEQIGTYRITGNMEKAGYMTSSKELFKIKWIIDAIEKTGKKYLVSQDSKYWVISLNANQSQKLKLFEWVQIHNSDRKSKVPSLSITKNGLFFSMPFVNEAQIDIKRFVKVSFSDEHRRIDFEFFKNEVKDSIKILGSREDQFYIARSNLFEKEWVKAIVDSIENRFNIEGNSKIWSASIAPAFEIKLSRENANQIPYKVSGIYRYLNKGEVVYIGKGFIKKRFAQPKRKGWEFDTIEYSEVQKEKQHYWENFWINSFKNLHGKLPRENKIHGFDK